MGGDGLEDSKSKDGEDDRGEISHRKLAKPGKNNASKPRTTGKRTTEESSSSQQQKLELQSLGTEKSWATPGIVLAALLALLISALLYIKLGQVDNNVHPDRVAMELLPKAIRELRKNFPAQREDTWRKLEANVMRILKPRSLQAACLVLLPRRPNSTGQSECFASTVGRVLASVIEGSWKPDSPPDSRRHQIDIEAPKFRNRFSHFDETLDGLLQQNRVAVLKRLNLLDGKTAMSLMKFCNDDPYGGKRDHQELYFHTVILSTLALQPEEAKNETLLASTAGVETRAMASKLAAKELRTRWMADLDEDRVSPLLSRVALSAVLFETEEASKTGGHCVGYHEEN